MDIQQSIPVYISPHCPKKGVLNNHEPVLDLFGISLTYSDKSLFTSSLFWIFKLHKDPYKQTYSWTWQYFLNKIGNCRYIYLVLSGIES